MASEGGKHLVNRGDDDANKKDPAVKTGLLDYPMIIIATVTAPGGLIVLGRRMFT